MENSSKYLFGPVPSRRLGLSLGVDIIPFKSCTQDCIYCQLGKAPYPQTVERKSFVPIDDVIGEVKKKIAAGLKADYITLSGSGEPTLNIDFGKLIDAIHHLTEIPVALITNGTLLYLPQVRKEACKADLIVPSLDGFDQVSFEKLNRPHSDISFEKLVDGLKSLRKDYTGPIWLEVFFIDGINTSDRQVEQLKKLIDEIKPDKVQINTAVRPTAEVGILPVSSEKLKHIAAKLGEIAEVIVDFKAIDEQIGEFKKNADSVLEMLKRRPCSVDDICTGLGIGRHEALKHVTHLLSEKKIAAEEIGQKTFYKSIQE